MFEARVDFIWTTRYNVSRRGTDIFYRVVTILTPLFSNNNLLNFKCFAYTKNSGLLSKLSESCNIHKINLRTANKLLHKTDRYPQIFKRNAICPYKSKLIFYIISRQEKRLH